MKRLKDISEIEQGKNNKWTARVEVADELNPYDVCELYDSLHSTVFNISAQIKQGWEQNTQIRAQVKQLEIKLKEFKKKRTDVKKHAKLAETLLTKKEQEKLAEARRKNPAYQKKNDNK